MIRHTRPGKVESGGPGILLRLLALHHDRRGHLVLITVVNGDEDGAQRMLGRVGLTRRRFHAYQLSTRETTGRRGERRPVVRGRY